MPMLPATASVPAYTKNGARSEIAVSGPPIAGPAIAPSRKPDCHRPVALPRWSAETTRSSRLTADTVNMAEPTPPIPRSSSSWT